MKLALIFLLAFPSYAWSMEVSRTDALVHPTAATNWSLASEVGVAQLNYKERFGASTTNLNETSLSAKIAAAYNFEGTSWDVGSTIAGTVATLTSNLESSAHFLNGDIFGAYSLTTWQQPIRLRMVGGVTYLKMFSNGGYGFKDVLAGLEMYPEISKRFSNGQIISGYIKFIPLLYQGGDTAYHSSDWESSLGVSYELSHLSGTHTLKTSIDFNMLRRSATVLGDANAYNVRANSVTAGIAYGI